MTGQKQRKTALCSCIRDELKQQLNNIQCKKTEFFFSAVHPLSTHRPTELIQVMIQALPFRIRVNSNDETFSMRRFQINMEGNHQVSKNPENPRNSKNIEILQKMNVMQIQQMMLHGGFKPSRFCLVRYSIKVPVEDGTTEYSFNTVLT